MTPQEKYDLFIIKQFIETLTREQVKCFKYNVNVFMIKNNITREDLCKKMNYEYATMIAFTAGGRVQGRLLYGITEYLLYSFKEAFNLTLNDLYNMFNDKEVITVKDFIKNNDGVSLGYILEKKRLLSTLYIKELSEKTSMSINIIVECENNVTIPDHGYIDRMIPYLNLSNDDVKDLKQMIDKLKDWKESVISNEKQEESIELLYLQLKREVDSKMKERFRLNLNHLLHQRKLTQGIVSAGMGYSCHYISSRVNKDGEVYGFTRRLLINLKRYFKLSDIELKDLFYSDNYKITPTH